MPDAYYSLFNDTINYFLTWNNSFNNKRTLNETDINYSNYNQKTFAGRKKSSNTIVNMYPGLNKVDYLAPNMN